MDILQLELKLQDITENINKDDFIFDFLSAYEMPKANITRLRKNSDVNTLDTNGELTVKNKKVFFKIVDDIDSIEIDKLVLLKKGMRFIIVTDFKKIKAVDTKLLTTFDISMDELSKNSDFFWAIAGVEKATVYDEKEADVKASIKMAKLYEEIIKTNDIETKEEIHSLNVFLNRLLFCYFAEDTDIFIGDNPFSNYIKSVSSVDGSDVDIHIDKLFDTLNSTNRDISNHLKDFPYVNGGLFKDKFPIPKFNSKSRRLLIECGGELDWANINPDIFGSMIQAVISDEHRGGNGMHYTSVPNIMKVINPLFLDDLKDEFEKAKDSDIKLNKLHKRIINLKIFDPACGSGNFLIIAYKELRRLEMEIFQSAGMLNMPSIKLSQFYGIELDDFAHEVAILSLWLTEHQMNIEFIKKFGNCTPTLPLQDGGNIVQGNATRLEWDEVCPKNDGDEIYVLGNPPYLGSRNQKPPQKEDMKAVFLKDYKSLDYIACWFYKGANYIRDFNSKLSFVSTNSISQGEQVALTWQRVLKGDLEISFVQQSFKWENNAKANANVIVVIIGVSTKNSNKKFIFKDDLRIEVSNINPYLTQGKSVYINRTSKPISDLIPIVFGNMPNDGGNLLLTTEEKNDLIYKYPNSEKFIKAFMGGREFLNELDIVRWCLWIDNEFLDEAYQIPEIKQRIENVVKHREKSTEKSTQKMAEFPHQFYFSSHKNTKSIIIPATTSERRKYIPIGFYEAKENIVISNSAQVIYDAEYWIFGVITSNMHMTWMRTVAGRLKSDYRYSSALVYNTFPFPKITQTQKDKIEELVHLILDERDKNYLKTLHEMYKPNEMPDGLKEAHHNLDIYIESCYRDKSFESDEERLEYLFRLYEKMLREEVK
ncbi:MAG: DNA methyltransferase [Campylobacterota bacterium]|nr:DNA methyltransferase [Campylobacterota bacterium]